MNTLTLRNREEFSNKTKDEAAAQRERFACGQTVVAHVAVKLEASRCALRVGRHDAVVYVEIGWASGDEREVFVRFEMP